MATGWSHHEPGREAALVEAAQVHDHHHTLVLGHEQSLEQCLPYRPKVDIVVSAGTAATVRLDDMSAGKSTEDRGPYPRSPSLEDSPYHPNLDAMSVSTPSLRSMSDNTPSSSPTPTTPTTYAFGPFSPMFSVSPSFQSPPRPSTPHITTLYCQSRKPSIDSTIHVALLDPTAHEKGVPRSLKVFHSSRRSISGELSSRRHPRRIESIDWTSFRPRDADQGQDQPEGPTLSASPSVSEGHSEPEVANDGSVAESEAEDSDSPPPIEDSIQPTGGLGETPNEDVSRVHHHDDFYLVSHDDKGVEDDDGQSSLDGSVPPSLLLEREVPPPDIDLSEDDEPLTRLTSSDESDCSTADKIGRTILEEVYDLHMPFAEPPAEIREAIRRCLSEISDVLEQGRQLGLGIPYHEAPLSSDNRSTAVPIHPSNRQDGQQRKRASGKSWGNDEDGDDEEFDGEGGDSWRAGDFATDAPNKRQRRQHLSCPYRLRNPLRFNIRDHEYCAKASFKDITELKKHLKLRHQLNPFSCFRCGAGFPSHELLVAHMSLPSKDMCEPNQRLSAPGSDVENGMTANAARDLASRKHHLEWEDIWLLLFPQDARENIPSPDFEPVVEVFEVERDFRKLCPDLFQKLHDGINAIQGSENPSLNFVLANGLERVVNEFVSGVFQTSRRNSSQYDSAQEISRPESVLSTPSRMPSQSGSKQSFPTRNPSSASTQRSSYSAPGSASTSAISPQLHFRRPAAPSRSGAFGSGKNRSSASLRSVRSAGSSAASWQLLGTSPPSRISMLSTSPPSRMSMLSTSPPSRLSRYRSSVASSYDHLPLLGTSSSVDGADALSMAPTPERLHSPPPARPPKIPLQPNKFAGQRTRSSELMSQGAPQPMTHERMQQRQQQLLNAAQLQTLQEVSMADAAPPDAVDDSTSAVVSVSATSLPVDVPLRPQSASPNPNHRDSAIDMTQPDNDDDGAGDALDCDLADIDRALGSLPNDLSDVMMFECPTCKAELFYCRCNPVPPQPEQLDLGMFQPQLLHTRQPSRDLSPTAVAKSNNPYQRPKHPTVFCGRCNEWPEGFRGEHELRCHMDAKHPSSDLTRSTQPAMAADPIDQFFDLSSFALTEQQQQLMLQPQPGNGIDGPAYPFRLADAMSMDALVEGAGGGVEEPPASTLGPASGGCTVVVRRGAAPPNHIEDDVASTTSSLEGHLHMKTTAKPSKGQDMIKVRRGDGMVVTLPIGTGR